MRTQDFPTAFAFILFLVLSPLARPGDAEISKLLARIRAEGNRVPHSVFYDLARLGGQESFDALHKATDLIGDQEALYAAYGAFRIYRDKEDLASQCVPLLEKDAFKDRRKEAQRAATWSLRYFGEPGEVALEAIAESHDDDKCREFAVMPILKRLGERGDSEAAELILKNAILGGDSQSEGVVSALKNCSGSKTRRLLLSKLKDRKCTPEWKLVVVETLDGDLDESVTKAFIKALEAEEQDARLMTMLIDSLGIRRASRAGRTLKSKLTSEHDTVRRAAVLAITQVLGDDRVWLNKLRTFAGEDDAVLRLASVQALCELRVADSTKLLQKFLADPDHRVRGQAIELLVAPRDKSVIPVLLDRLDAEHGPLRLRIARVLRLLTGKDFGIQSVRWRAWWKAEGEGFVVPSAKITLELEHERRMQKAAEGRTQSTFYGLPVLSQNVCFVLDVSGSMKRKVDAKPRTASDPVDEDATGPARIEVAKLELKNVLASLKRGTYANIVFFESEAFSWSDELVLMTDETKKEAQTFIARAKPDGGTDVHEGLERAFDDPRVDTIYLLTDGQPREGLIVDPARLRKEVRIWNSVRRVQIHCISVGRESEFLRELARENGGDYRVSM